MSVKPGPRLSIRVVVRLELVHRLVHVRHFDVGRPRGRSRSGTVGVDRAVGSGTRSGGRGRTRGRVSARSVSHHPGGTPRHVPGRRRARGHRSAGAPPGGSVRGRGTTGLRPRRVGGRPLVRDMRAPALPGVPRRVAGMGRRGHRRRLRGLLTDPQLEFPDRQRHLGHHRDRLARLHLTPVEQRAVRRPEVVELRPRVVEPDHGVPPGHERKGQRQIVERIPPDPHRRTGEGVVGGGLRLGVEHRDDDGNHPATTGT